MYPNDIVFGLDLYEIMIALGFFACLLVFRFCADKRDLSAPFQNLVMLSGLAGILLGYLVSVVVQAVYNAIETGEPFRIASDTGATFLGGLLGGASTFLLCYFIAGHFLFKDRFHVTHGFEMANLCAPSIITAHAFGRLGCLFAGCCYGRPTTHWYGVWNEYLGQKTVPVQLIESLFLFALAAWLISRNLRGKCFNLPLYMACYGVFRFFIEYLRADDRGATVVSFLSPSQLTSILLLLGAIAVFLCERAFYRRAEAKKSGTEAQV